MRFLPGAHAVLCEIGRFHRRERVRSRGSHLPITVLRLLPHFALWGFDKAAFGQTLARRVFYTETFRGPATVFADRAFSAPAVAAFSVHMPVKSSRTVSFARAVRANAELDYAQHVCPPGSF